MNKIINIFKINVDNSNRIFGLDLLRAAAIIFVLISHQGGIWPSPNWYFGVFGKLMGYDGVSIFFVLSGFLIGGILIKIIDKETMTLKTLFDFWIRRWFRTLPVYFFVLLLVCGIYKFFGDGLTGKEAVKHFIFTQNIFNPHPCCFYPEAWSLAVEEWFYILIPILIYIFINLFKVSAKRSILYTSIVIIIVITFFRYYRFSTSIFQNMEEWDLLFRKQVSTRVDSLMYGVLGAYIQFYHNAIWQKHKSKLLITGIIFLLIFNFVFPKTIPVNSLFNAVFSFTFMSVATVLLLPFLSNFKENKLLFSKLITHVSLISYSLYLLNLTVVNIWIINKFQWDNLTNNLIINLLAKNISYWIILISGSTLLYKYVEIPMTKLRDKIKL